MKARRVWVVWLLGFGWMLAGTAGAQESGIPAYAPVCEPPISICRPFPVISLEAATPIDPCPPGSSCKCVPSCPTCLDCAVWVCVPDGGPECRTACECPPGLGCFEGRCLAGFAPIYCCERDPCPPGAFCQHGDRLMAPSDFPVSCCIGEECPEGTRCDDVPRFDRCEERCSEEVWLCGRDGLSADVCGEGRVCSCTASCKFCEDCGPPVCIPEGAPVPYRCDSEASCGPDERCVCVSSCPACDDCVFSVCVPRCDGPTCEERRRTVTGRIEDLVKRASRCEAHRECALANTSTECQGTCGAWVNRRYRHRVGKIVRRLDERICSTYLEDGCPRAIPLCMFQRGLCVDGHCRGVPVLPIPLDPDADVGILEVPLEELQERIPQESR